MKEDIVFLDCTLRDGGYYNSWDFDLANSEKLLKSLNRAGVDIIEVGYKSPENSSTFYGLYKYCNEEYLSFLSKSDSSQYAFMIDVKEFIVDDKVDFAALDQLVLPAEKSIFSWVRLASHFATIQHVEAMTTYFKDLGYIVGFNLMGGSLLSEDQIIAGLEVAKSVQTEVFYLADSFGSFYPEDIRKLVRLIKTHYQGDIGIHTHDNQGMAYANSLAAIEEGVKYVDATVTGMGRGAGNLHTEQFLMGYAKKENKSNYKAAALLPIISDYIAPMKAHYKWGFSPAYMYSGLHNIHPTYCQKLIEGQQFTPDEQSLILGKIPPENRTKYSVKALEMATSELLTSELKAESSNNLPLYSSDQLAAESCIILAKGPEGAKNIKAIKNLKNRGVRMIECNHTGLFAEAEERVLVMLNQVRLTQWIQKEKTATKAQIIFGMPNAVCPENADIRFAPFDIGNFDATREKVQIPDFDAGLYAIALALKAGVQHIYLAGFDRFEDKERNRSKNALLDQIALAIENTGVKIHFITASRYNAFPVKSIYTI